MQTLLFTLRRKAQKPVLSLVFAAMAVTSGPVSSEAFFWDTDSSTVGNDPDGSGLGGSGTWDTATGQWWDLSSLIAWPNSGTDQAIFSYAYPGLGIPVQNSVTVDAGGVNAGRISFLRSGYTLSGGVITLASSTPTLHATLGDSATILSNLLGTAGLTKNGGGSIRLSGDNSGLTGPLSIANGTLIISSPLALPGTGAVSILTNNETPLNTNQVGFFGGSLMLDGTATGFTFARDVNLEGRGPLGDRGSAILSLGDNTLSGTIMTAVSPLPLSPTATFRNSRINSVNGILDLAGTVVSQGTATTTFLSLGGINSAGAGNFNLSGVLSGSGSIEKSGAGTLFWNPLDTSNFSGTLRISASATGQQSTVRVTGASVGGTSIFGSNAAATTGAAIDLNGGGVLEFRSDSDLNFGALGTGRNIYTRSTGSIFTGPAAGGSGVNGVTTLGALHQNASGTGATNTTTFNSRNGYGVTLSTLAVDASTSTTLITTNITNSMGGNLTFTGNVTMPEGSTSSRPRTFAFGGNGNTVIQGSVIAGTDAGKVLTKSGTGNLTIAGTGTTVAGPVNITAGAISVTDFRSLNNNTSSIVLGNATTTGGNLIIGGVGTSTAAGLTTSKAIVLNTTSAGNSIYANQAGVNPVILNGAITKIAAATTGPLILGGTNTAENIVNVVIPVESTPSTGGLTKLGSGIWVMNAANTYRGATTIQNGSLKLRATGGASDVIGSTSTNTVVFSADGITQSAGGTLEFRGFLDTVTTEELGALTPTAGAAKVVTVANGSGSAALTFTALGARGAGAYVDYQVGAATSLFFGTAPAVTNGILGAASASAFQTYNGVDWATLSGNQLVQYSGYTTLPASFSGTGGATVNYSLFGNSASTGTASVNTLKLVGGGANPTLTLGGILTLTGRATLFDNTSGVGTISGSQLGASATEVHVITNGASGGNGGVAGEALTLGNALMINSLIGGGTGSLTKSGTGSLIVTGNNAFTGNVIVNEGLLQLSGGTATLGVNSTAGNITTIRQGATLDINAAGVSQMVQVGALQGAGVITNSGGGTGTAGTISFGRSTSTGATIFSGVLQNGVSGGVLNVTVDGTTARTQAFIGQNTYTGVTTIATGAQLTVDVLANGGVTSGIGASTGAAENLVFNGTAPALIYRGNLRTGSLNLGSASASTNRLFTISGSGATLSSTVTNNNAIVWSNTGAIAHGTNANRTLTLTGTSTGDNTFNPQLTDSTGFVTSLSKTAAGQWNLGNSNNTYTGTTSVANGILALNDSGALPANSPLVLGATTTSGILQAFGTFARNLAATATAGNGTITWGGTTGGGGFAAHSTPLSVTLNSGAGLTWGSGGFVGAGSLILNSASALSDVTFTNAIDLNSGSVSTPTVTTTDASAVVTSADTSGLVSGQPISGPGIPAGAVIVSVTSGTTFVISANATTVLGAGTGPASIGSATRTITVNDNATTGADYATLSGVISGLGGNLLKNGGGVLRLTGANTYSGTTSVQGGTLVISSLGSSTDAPNTPTSVGVSGLAMNDSNAIILGNTTTTGGILQYVGGGEVSDRKIRLQGTTAGNQIHADGSGPLILTNVAHDTVATGNKTLSLRGSNTAGNMITSQLTDNGAGILSIGVDGGATWILTNGSNSYTGTTTVGAGALGIGHNTTIGGALTISNGNVFAYGGDRTLTNTVNLGNNATSGFIGDYNLTFNGTNNFAAGANNLNVYNSVAPGKAVIFNGLIANVLTANRTWVLDGPGETVVNGAFTTSTTFGVAIQKNGNGTLVLGTNGAVSNWNQAGAGIDLDRGTLRFAANEAIPTAAPTDGGLTISPEVATTDTATVDLNGTTQTVNALTATSNGVLVLDNTAAAPATFRFGANDSVVNFGSGLGSYSILNSGVGALSIVKLGNTTTTFNSGMILGHAGITASEGGGSFTIASAVNATSGLRAIGGSTLALTGGITNSSLITGIEVGGGSTLSLLDGAGSAISNLTNLTLGAGAGTATLNLNIGDGATDTLTLLTGGVLSLNNSVTFNLTDTGLSPLTTYTLLNLVDGGITGFGPANMIQGTTPGGFSGFTWNVTDNLVQITTGSLVTGSLYWRGVAGGGTDTTWNASANNWSANKANTSAATTTPGQGTDVIFAINSTAGDVVTTLDQNFKINSLTFEAGATTPTSVTIAPGVSATNRLEVAPQVASDGVEISAGGPAAVTISAPFRLGADQTWTVADAASTLTFSGGLLGERDVTLAGPGRVILSGVADPTFNSGRTSDFSINGGALEITNAGALGTVVNSNLANVIVNTGGAFFYNGAAATIPNALTLNGGTLSAGTASQVYSGAVNISNDSLINLRENNSAVTTTTPRTISLSGVLSGSGDLTVDSIDTVAVGNQITGDLVITNAGNNGWSGDLNLLRGTVTARTGNADALGTGAIKIEFGKVEWEGAGGTTYNIAKPLTVARADGNAVAEWNIDRTSGTGTFTVDNSGTVTLGGAGGTGELRVFYQDIATNNVGTAAIFSGGVTLANNASIHARDNGTLALATFSGGVSETGGARALTINGPAGGGTAWGGTSGIVHLSGPGTYTGGTTLVSGGLRLGNKDAIGTGVLTISGTSTLSASTPLTGVNAVTNAIAQNASFSFFGTNSLELSGGINLGAGGRTITANGDTGASLLLTGAISNLATGDGSALTLAGNATGTGTIRGGFLMTGDSADLTVSGGHWTHDTATSRIGDDLTVSGSTAVLTLSSGLLQVRDDVFVTTSGTLNLNGAGAMSFNTPTLSGDASLRAYTGGTITINADNAVVVTEFDGLRIGTDGSGTGNLVMNANQQVVEFILGNRNFDRSGNITGTGTITVTGNLDVYQGGISANLASTGSTAFEKLSNNAVTLSGDNSGLASTGATIVYEGNLTLDYTTSNTTKFRAASQLDMRGSNLILSGNASAATSQSVGSFTLASGFGSSRIVLNPGAGQDLVLNLGAITRTVNSRSGTVRFVLPSGTQSATNGITTTTAVTAGLLGTAGYATVDNGTGTWFATKDGNNIVAFASTPKNDVATWLAGDHVTDETTGYTGIFSSVLISSLRFNAAAGGSVNLGVDGVLGISTGGILVTDQVAGTPGILGGTLFSGAQASGVPELIVTHDGATTFEIGADIRTNSAFTKSGTGTVLLSGNNTATGFTTVQNGVLEISGGNAIGDFSPVTLATYRNSTLRLLSSETIGRLDGGQRQVDGEWGIVDIGSHTLTINQNATTTFGGRFVGTGAIVMGAAGSGNLNANGASSGFTGTVEVNGGLFQLSGVGQNNASAITVNGNGMMLIDNNGTTSSTTRILDTTPITLNSAAGGGTNIRGLWVRNTDNNSSRFETIGNLNFGSGANYLTGEATVGTGSGRAGIIASNFVRTNNATFSARGRNLGTALTHHNQFRIATANEAAFIATLVGGGGIAGSHTISILPWGIGETHNATTTGGTNMGNSFVTYVAGAGLRPLDLATEYDIFATAGLTDNVRESLAANLTGLAGTTVNALALHNSAAAAAAFQVTGNGVGQSLAITSGALLFTLNPAAAAGDYGITLGGFDDGIVTAAGEYVFHVVNPSAAATTPVLTATIGSLLTSAADITKSGRGTLVLTGANTAGGGGNKTTINEGVLEIAALANIGGASGNLVFAGGTLRLGALFDEGIDILSDRTITFQPGGGTLDTNGNDPVLGGSLGSGAGGFTKAGLGNLTLNAAATYTGPTLISGGTVTVGANDALGVGGNLTVTGSTLALGTNTINHGLVTTSGASPLITGTGTINATAGYFFNHTGDTTIDATLAGAGDLLKAQTNVVTLTGLNSYTGTTEIQNGTLGLNSIGNVGGGASAVGAPTTVENGIIRMGLLTAATTLQYTGSGHISDRIIGMQGTTGGVTLDANGTGAVGFGGVRFENAGNKTLTLRGSSDAALENTIGRLTEIGGVLSVFKTDSNTWVYTASNLYTGTTTVDNGILRLDAAQDLTGALRFGSAGTITTTGTLEVRENSSFGPLTVQPNGSANLVIDSDRELTINGNVVIGSATSGTVTNFIATGGGDFTVNSPTNTGNTFHVGGTGTSNVTLADFSDLATMNVSLNPTGGIFLVSSTSGTNLTGKAELRLADSTTITANALTVGGGGTYNGNVDQVNLLKLGTTANFLNVNTINIGTGARDLGSVTFQDPTGTLTVRAADGTSATAFNMGTGTANTGVALVAGNRNTFDVTGHDADLLFGAVNIGTQNARTGGMENLFAFDQGTLATGNLTMGSKTAAGNSTNVMNLGGGTVTIGSGTGTAATLASNTSTGAVSSTINVTAGTVTIGSGSGQALILANSNTNATGSSTGVLNISGGDVTLATTGTTAVTLANASAGTSTGSISVTGGSLTAQGAILSGTGAGIRNASVTLDGGLLDMRGNAIGASGNSVVLNARSGTLRNLGELNGGSTLNKTTAGTLILDTSNSYTGATTVSAGVLQVSHGGALGDTVAGTTVADGAVLELSGNITTANEALTLNGSGISDGGALRNTSGNNTYSGNITLATASRINSDAGLLILDATTGAAIVASDQNFTLGGAGNITVADAITLGTGNLVKDGAGTVILSGDNSYTGTTTVSDGLLMINGDSSLATGAATVASGATLGGSGTIGGISSTATIASGGTLTGGNDGSSGTVGVLDPLVTDAVGTLSFGGSLTASSGSIWLVDLVQGGTADLISVGGALDITGANLAINFGGAFVVDQVYTIASYGGGLTGTFAGLGEGAFVDPGNLYRINYGTGPSGAITLTAVPEPGTLGMLGLALGGFFVRRIRRRRATAAAVTQGQE